MNTTQTAPAIQTSTFSFDTSDNALTENGPAQPYSADWINAWVELRSVSDYAAQSMARRVARRCQPGRQRIRVVLFSGRAGSERDTVDAFGWRAALAAVRALRAESRAGEWVVVYDARMADLRREWCERSMEEV